LGPTYTEHARAWARAGIKTIEVTSFEALSEADVAVLCNPNNPDGRRFEPEHLLRLADRLAEHRGLLVVDEAFADLEDDGLSLAPALPHPSLIVLRSFGKTYGLAGLRLGFALGAPDRILRIRDSLGPWAVSGPAIAVGRQALRDQAWLTMTRERLAHRLEELDAVLSDKGLNVVGGTRLFRLVETENAPTLFAQLGGSGIFVRRFAGQPRWLRFGQPGNDANMERVRAALRNP
jgi:cobalamin biosynthetic protein CobC